MSHRIGAVAAGSATFAILLGLGGAICGAIVGSISEVCHGTVGVMIGFGSVLVFMAGMAQSVAHARKGELGQTLLGAAVVAGVAVTCGAMIVAAWKGGIAHGDESVGVIGRLIEIITNFHRVEGGILGTITGAILGAVTGGVGGAILGYQQCRKNESAK